MNKELLDKIEETKKKMEELSDDDLTKVLLFTPYKRRLVTVHTHI